MAPRQFSAFAKHLERDGAVHVEQLFRVLCNGHGLQSLQLRPSVRGERQRVCLAVGGEHGHRACVRRPTQAQARFKHH